MHFSFEQRNDKNKSTGSQALLLFSLHTSRPPLSPFPRPRFLLQLSGDLQLALNPTQKLQINKAWSSTFSPSHYYVIREWFYSRLVSREMDIYDKNSRCLMSEGEYELLLSEDLTIPNGDQLPNKRNGSWENVSTNVLFGNY